MSKIYDTNKVKEIAFKDIFEVLREHPDTPIEQLESEFNKDIDEHFQYIRVSELFAQEIRNEVAGLIIEPDERKLWWLHRIIMKANAHPQINGEIRKVAGNNYNKVMDHIITGTKNVNTIKYILDMMDKTSPNTELWRKLYHDYLITVKKINIINYEVYDIFNIITENTNIGTRSISEQTLQMMLKSVKKPELREERREEMESRRESQRL